MTTPLIDETKNAESLTSQALLVLVGRTVAFGLTFALPILLVRQLSQAEFGLYKQVFLVVGTAMMVLSFGVSQSAYYFLPRERERRGEVILNILLFYVVTAGGAALALALRPDLLAAVFGAGEIVELGPLLGLVIFLWVVPSMIEAVSQANGEARYSAAITIASQFSKTVLLVGAALVFGTVRALVLAAVLQGVVQSLLVFSYLRSRFGRFWERFDPRFAWQQLAYALPIGFAAMVSAAQADLSHYFVSHEFGPDQYALYAIGTFSLPFVGILTHAAGTVMVRRVSYLQSAGDVEEIIRLSARMLRKLAAALLPAYALLLVVAPELIAFLFTPTYAAAVPLFILNLTVIPMALLMSFCDPVVKAFAEHRFYMLKVRVGVAAGLGLALWAVTGRYGMLAALGAVVAAGLVERAFLLARVRGILGLERRHLPLFGDLWRIALASAIAAGLAVALRPLLLAGGPLAVLAGCGAAFGAVYAALLVVFGVVRVEDRHALAAAVSGLAGR